MRNGVGTAGRKRTRFGIVRDRTVLALTAATALGVLLVAIGWIMEGPEYVPGMLLELGASMVLLVPLALLGFLLEGRVRQAEEQIRVASARLDALSAVTRERLEEHSRRRGELIDEARHDPTRELVRVLLQEAGALDAIAASGVRIRMEGTTLRVRFRLEIASETLHARLEEADGTELRSLVWESGQSSAAFAENLANTSRAEGRYPGDAAFDPSTLLLHLVNLLGTGIDARTGAHPYDLGPLIEIPNPQWAVSSDGLFSLERPYHISVEDLRSRQDWPGYMRSQPWVNIDHFVEAYQLAGALIV